MKKYPIVAFGLFLGFSANAVFAENKPVNYNPVSNELTDRLAQVQLQAVEAKSRFLDEVKAGKINAVRPLPSSNTKNDSVKREPKPHVTGRKKTMKEEIERLVKSGKWKPSKDSNLNLTKSTTAKTGKHENQSRKLKPSKREARIYKLIMNARNLDELSQAEKMQILALHKRLLKTVSANILLDTIQSGEGGGPLVIVGKGIRKSKKFKEIMKRLNLSTHPAYQFPKDMRCFVYNKQVGKCSTASGLYQITKTNFDFYAKQFGLKDFSIETQKIIALELIRTGRAKMVKGNYKGRGYVELLKENINNAIRYGTNDWASSPYSEWGGAKADYLGKASQIANTLKKQRRDNLKDQTYFQSWIDDVEKTTASE